MQIERERDEYSKMSRKKSKLRVINDILKNNVHKFPTCLKLLKQSSNQSIKHRSYHNYLNNQIP